MKFFFKSAFLRNSAVDEAPEDLDADSNVRHINPGKPRPKVKPIEKELDEPEVEVEDTNSYQTSAGYTPKHLVTAYKLFRVDPKRPGKLFPLFVAANTPIPMGVWVDAAAGELTPEGKVKSKLGPLAYRPGFHAGDVPVATHIGLRGANATPTHRNPNYVWAEVSMPDDLDWQSEASGRMKHNKKNQPIPGSADINDQVPFGGHYRYKTNPNMAGEWMISGNMRINKVLNDDEVGKINAINGVSDLPRAEPLNLALYGFGPNGKPL